MEVKGVSHAVIMQFEGYKDIETPKRYTKPIDQYLMSDRANLEKKSYQFAQHLQTDKKLDIF
jgi:hypothetical protein